MEEETVEKFGKFKKLFQIIPLVVVLLGLILVPFKHSQIKQAGNPIMMDQGFEGQYRYGDGPWLELDESVRLSALEGDLQLRGHVTYPMEAGTCLNYYLDHIGARIFVNGERIREDILFEMEEYGVPLQSAMCGCGWDLAILPATLSPEDLVEIHLKNPHGFGNENAYRDFLRSLGGSMDTTEQLRTMLIPYERGAQVVGGVLLIVAIMLLGAALIAALQRIYAGMALVKYGLLALFLGGNLLLDTVGLSLWSENRAFNTYTLQLCMMFSIYWMELCAMDQFTGWRKKVAVAAAAVSAVRNSVLVIFCLAGSALLYDLLPFWAYPQLVCSGALLCCAVLEALICKKSGERVLKGIYAAAFLGVILDICGVANSFYSHGTFTKILLVVLLLYYFADMARKMIRNHQATVRAEKLESELEENRISIMLSQIQPHFLYNMLGTIRGLCREDPEQARQALGDFSKYLRGNMDALTNSRMIHFTAELRHIETYLRLEKMRLGSRLTVVYDMEEMDFYLPPLTVQPLVENAVKHGIFHKPQGGTVRLSSKSLGEMVQICVSDDGVGFDPQAPACSDEEHTHVGLQNIESRLQKMRGGALTVESVCGQGTKATILINKNWTEGEV